jgi:hypothetical protein
MHQKKAAASDAKKAGDGGGAQRLPAMQQNPKNAKDTVKHKFLWFTSNPRYRSKQ